MTTTEERLRAALRTRAATASPSPDALVAIRRRIGGRRWTVRVQVAAAAAAVATVAVAASALDREPGRRPQPPTTSDSPSPTPSAQQAAVGTDEYVALLEDGRLVVASASTGRITRVVLTGARPAEAEFLPRDPYSVALAPDRRSAFLATPAGGCAIDRVDLATGERTRIAAGRSPDVSPDGTRLAYVGCDDTDTAVVVRDLRTGAEQRFGHIETEVVDGDASPWMLYRAVWHADGRRLWVVVDWENLTELRLLDPATDRDTGDAEKVPTRYTTYDLERGGGGLVYHHECCYADEDGEDMLVLRDVDGTEDVLLRAPRAQELGDIAAGPGGGILYVRSGRLYRLDVAEGTSTDLGASNALARDW